MYYKKSVPLLCLMISLLLILACKALLLDQSLTVAPSPTFTLVPTFAPTFFAYLTPSESEEPFVPFYIRTFENMIAFTGPGGIFSEVARIPQNTNLLILGQSIGNEWVHIQLPSSETAWVSAKDLQLEIRDVPTIKPKNAQMIVGRVVDEGGQPVSGVRFSILRFVEDYGIGTGGTTDNHGFFYSFMPLDINGEWIVWYQSLACDSNKMPSGCVCPQRKCGQTYPQVTTVTLPQNTPILFIWK